ncbi:hypothetical protein L1887_38091 [Cichorium endivia]|nr:hypothetical protein L1887_38091 [Cichorium endivia]
MSSIGYKPSGDSREIELESKQNYVISSNGNHEKQQNGTYNIYVDSCNKSDLSSKISLIPGKSSDKSNMNSASSNDTKGNKKFSVTRISKAKSINVDFRLSRGIAQVNEGHYTCAISIFDQILGEDPTYPEALIGRGTTYAFKRELDSTVADFTKLVRHGNEEARRELHPSLQRRIEHLAGATANTRSHEAPFHNMLFYGPPGTGKTLVAREIARKSIIAL